MTELPMAQQHGEVERRAVDAVLRDVFGHPSFRPGQRAVVEAVLAERPVIAVMPTGAGKSLCYQLPALVLPGTTLVISPLIALRKDQVDALSARGVPASFINSTLPPAERERRLQEARSGRTRLLYVAPERFRSPRFVDAIQSINVSRVAIDEAHCISQWGHDFRPDYVRLGDALRELDLRRVCAFTATATPMVRDDIIRVLGLHDPEVFVHGFRRHNLTLRVIPIRRMRDKIAHIERLRRHTGGAGIVYAATRKHVEAVAAALGGEAGHVGVYHGGLSDAERHAAHERFMSGELRVMVATNAFGMGIDRRDIRFVIHYDMPGSLEAYYQEAGRAGRDGEPSDCAILFTYADVRIHEFFIDRIGEDRHPSDPHVAHLKNMERMKLRRMIAYCYSGECRHAELLGYFGEREEGVRCTTCDCCLSAQGVPPPDWSVPAGAGRSRSLPAGGGASPGAPLTEGRALSDEEAVVLQKLLSAFVRVNGRLSADGVSKLVRAGRGELPDDLRESRSYGILRGMKAAALRTLVTELLARGVLKPSRGRRNAYQVTPFGREVMWRRADVKLDLPPFAPRSRAHASSGPAAADEDDHDTALFDRLRELRKELADDAGLAPFVVAHNTVLRRLAASCPTTSDDMLAVKGIGEASLERFGYRFLEVIRDHVRERG